METYTAGHQPLSGNTPIFLDYFSTVSVEYMILCLGKGYSPTPRPIAVTVLFLRYKITLQEMLDLVNWHPEFYQLVKLNLS